MPRRLFAFTGVLVTLLAFAGADTWILTRAFCDKAFVEAALRRAVGRHCTFHRMEPVPFRGITVSRLRLESAQMPRGLNVFQIERVSVSFDAAELASGNVVPAEVTLERPELNLVPNRQGEYELAQLFTTISESTGRGGGPPAPMPVWHVRNGFVRVQDEAVFRRDYEQRVSDVDLEVVPREDGTARVEGSLLLDGIGRFSIAGVIDLVRNSWRVELASLPTERIELGPRIADILADTPEHDLRGSWNNYKPVGPVDLRVQVSHDPDHPLDDFTVMMDTHGISATAKAFPFPVQDAVGHFEFRREGAVIRAVKGRSGRTGLSIDGKTEGYEADAGFHLEIEMTDLPLDREVRNALHPSDRDTYDRFSPSGIADARAEVDRPVGVGQPIRNHVWIRCKDAQFTYRGFPYPISKVAGDIELDGDRIVVKGVTGQSDLTSVVVNGTLADISGDAEIDMRIEGTRIPLDDRLYRALGDDAKRVWKRLDPKGQVNLVWEGKRRKGTDQELSQHVAILANGIGVLYDGFPYALSSLHGEVVYDSAAQTVEIHGVDGRHEDAKVRVRGKVRDIGGQGAFELSVEGIDVPLDADLRRALTPENQKTWDLFAPSGLVDLLWEGKAVGGRNQDVRQTLSAKLKGCHAKWERIPIAIEGITGQISYGADGTRIEHLKGRRGDADVELAGTIGPGDDPAFDVTVGVRDLPLTEDVVAALPERARDLLTESKARGSVDLAGRFTLADDTGGRRRTLYSAEVGLDEVDLDLGTPLSRIEGKVVLSGEVDSERHRARGAADVGRLRVNGKLLSKVHGEFVYEDDRLVFQGIRGEAYKGRIAGEAKLDLKEGTFTADLALADLDLATFARDTFVSDKTVAGDLDGHAVIAGKAKDRETWTGTVDLDVRDGELWEVPLFYRIFSVISLKDDRKGKFDTGTVKSEVRGGKFHVKKMDFEGANVRLEGKGKVGFGGELDLQLNTHLKSMGLGPLDPLGKLLDPITKNLYAVQAEGTFQEPEMSLRPLPFLWGKDEDDGKKDDKGAEK